MRHSLNIIFIIIASLFIYCTSKAQEKSNFIRCDTSISKKYTTDLKTKYTNYDIQVDSQVKIPIGFIGLYIWQCERGDTFITFENEYKVINVCNFDFDNSKFDHFFYSELICFRNVAVMNRIILKIKKSNCPNPYSLELDKIYIIGTNEALFVNFYPTFNVPDFEKFLMSEFGRNLKIITINTPDIREVPQNIRDRMKKG